MIPLGWQIIHKVEQFNAENATITKYSIREHRESLTTFQYSSPADRKGEPEHSIFPVNLLQLVHEAESLSEILFHIHSE